RVIAILLLFIIVVFYIITYYFFTRVYVKLTRSKVMSYVPAAVIAMLLSFNVPFAPPACTPIVVFPEFHLAGRQLYGYLPQLCTVFVTHIGIVIPTNSRITDNSPTMILIRNRIFIGIYRKLQISRSRCLDISRRR